MIMLEAYQAKSKMLSTRIYDSLLGLADMTSVMIQINLPIITSVL
jgi:hypothetical protein